jgi:hypothetical protein
MRRLIAMATLAALLLLAPTALGVTKNGLTPMSPKQDDSVPAGKRATFKLRYSGRGQIWVHICKSKAKDSDGVICSGESIGRATKTSSTRARYRAKFFDYPEFWLNSPGTYYWQAYRIACEGGDISDCRQEGPIVKFKVR